MATRKMWVKRHSCGLLIYMSHVRLTCVAGIFLFRATWVLFELLPHKRDEKIGSKSDLTKNQKTSNTQNLVLQSVILY